MDLETTARAKRFRRASDGRAQKAFLIYATIGAMSSSAINGSGNPRTTLMKKKLDSSTRSSNPASRSWACGRVALANPEYGRFLQ